MLTTVHPTMSDNAESAAETVVLTVEVYTEECMTTEQSLFQSRQDRHKTMLWVSILVLVLSFAFAIKGTGNTASVLVGGIEIPSLCTSRSWFRIECPGCGLTRSFVSLAGGDIEASLGYHRLGWLLFLAVTLQIPYRILSLRELRTGVVLRNWPSWLGLGLIGSLIVNWLLKIAL